MKKLGSRIVCCVLALCLGACSWLHRQDLVAPDVAIASLRMGPGEGMYQTVLVDLVITNPNDIALELDAISYRVRLQGRDLVNGMSREPLHVDAGGVARYTVPATFNKLNSMGFIKDLLRKPREGVRYELEVTLEPRGMFAPPMTVKKSDLISLSR